MAKVVARPGTVLVAVAAGRSVQGEGGEFFGPGAVMAVPLDEALYLFEREAAIPAPASMPDWSGVPVGPEFCSPTGGRCSDAKDYSRERRACCREIVRELLRFVGPLLDEYKIPWWADYGTLLGAVRHGGMIPWDKDADIGILATDLQTVAMLGQACKAIGMGFDRSGIGTLKFRCSPTNQTNLDVFGWIEDPDGTFRRRRYASSDTYKGKAFHRDQLFPLSSVEFDGLTLPAPRDPEAFCAHRYGEDWRTPVRANHDGQVRP